MKMPSSKTQQPTAPKSTQEVQVLPEKPLLSSRELNLNLDGIFFEYHHQPAWEVPWIYSPHHSIIVMHSERTDTERCLDSYKQSDSATKGDIVIIPANTPNHHNWSQEIEFFALGLDPQHIAQTAYEAISVEQVGEILPHFATPDPLIYQFCLGLKSEIELGKSCSHIYVDSLVTALSIHLIRKYSAKKPSIEDYTSGLCRSKLRRSISYINEHLTENLSLKTISDVVEMSPFYFTNLFKQSTGMTAYQYVIHCRIERAKHLLCKQDLPIADVSQKVGFESQSHFTNVFRKHTNTTPKKYREAKK
jgi:AraC family transcriptional regulator